MHEARTLHAANKRLCRLRGSPQDFSRVPAAILYGDFHQFRPVQVRYGPPATRSCGGCSADPAGQDPSDLNLLNSRNRWKLHLEAARDFLSKNNATPVPAVLVFVPGMPVVINQNTHQGLKPVNGARYTVVDAKVVKLDYHPDD
ncbi:hypothetical protein HRG_012876 [Hirsutella rhossiliensis]